MIVSDELKDMQHSDFVTLDNLKECEGRLTQFLASSSNHSGVRFETNDELFRIRQEIYRAMVEVNRSRKPGATIRALNNHAINRAFVALKNGASADVNPGRSQPRPAATSPSTSVVVSDTMQRRDLDLYGMRPVADRVPIPTSTSDARRGEIVDATHKAEVETRAHLNNTAASTMRSSQPDVIESMRPEEFEARLEELTASRASAGGASSSALSVSVAPEMSTLQWNRREAPPPVPPIHLITERDPSSLYRTTIEEDKELFVESTSNVDRSALLLPVPTGDNSIVTTKYLLINASDRDYLANPFRFKFSARTSGNQDGSSLTGSYRDITWIEATKVVLPMEISRVTNSLVDAKSFYRMDFSFAYQYVLLRLDGFDSIYDGTNDVVRRAFAMLVYDRHYQAPNGRGYVILRPIQSERMVFPTPLASLRDLDVAILKPNGTLFNNSTDSYTASHFQYETSNRMYIKVVLDQYYDRNELFVGDSILIRKCDIEAVPSASGSVPDHIAAFIAFINREEGHEIVQISATNEQGFVNAIYILAPGVLDVSVGRILIDEKLISVITALGQGPTDPDAVIRVTSPARILNVSLQPVVAMRVGCRGGFFLQDRRVQSLR
jgi:hypothetical protein